MTKVFAFDVDDTLEISKGPVTLKTLMDLRVDGHIIGLCGNHVPVVSVPGWQHLISFFNLGLPKDLYLGEFKKYVAALEYIMVGNIGPNDALFFNLPQTGGSDDMGAATRAGWRFIKEIDFANGAR